MTNLTVWYDGACPLCTREIALMRRLDKAHAITFLDVASDDASCPIDRRELLARFHAMENGTMLSGAAAFAAMWRAIPWLRPLGMAARNRTVLFGLERLYRVFLRVRPSLQSLLRRIDARKAGCMTVFVDAAINPPKMTQARLIALLTFLVLTLATLIALGTWQLQRRAWKADLIQKFEQNLDGLPVPYQGPASEIGPSAREFRKVAVRGRFLEKSDILVFAPTPSQFQGLTTEGYGYFVFTPFVAALEQRSTIMFINRGFAPASFALSSGSLPPVGDVTVEGMIRLPEEPTFATPEPGITKRIFYTAQIDAMSKTLALSADAIVAEYVEDLTPAVPKMWPRPRNPKLLLETIPNSHLQYALTWFSLAGTLVGVFAVFGLQRMRHRSSPG